MDVTNELDVFKKGSPWKQLLKSIVKLTGCTLIGAVLILVRLLRRVLSSNETLKKWEFALNKQMRIWRSQAMLIPPPTVFHTTESEVESPMRDGVVLKSWLILPASAPNKKYSTILMRTPYDKNSPLLGKRLCNFFAERYGILFTYL